jgi:hypothetical protein
MFIGKEKEVSKTLNCPTANVVKLFSLHLMLWVNEARVFILCDTPL